MTSPFLPKTCFTTNFSSCGARLDLSTEQSLGTSVAMSPAGDSFVGYASPAGQVRVIPGPAGGVPSTQILSPTARLPALAADADGNAVAVWSETAGGNMAAGYDAAPPQITGVTIPAVGRARRPGWRVGLRVRRLGCERALGLRRRRHGAGLIRRARVRAHRNVRRAGHRHRRRRRLRRRDSAR